MNYSRALKVEHEKPTDNKSEDAYTIFSLTQPYTLDFRKANKVCIQTLGVLWGKHDDTRLIWMIEQALIDGVLPPVKLLEASKGTLNVVYDSHLSRRNYLRFEKAWTELASGAWYDCWTADFFNELQTPSSISGGRIFRDHAPDILRRHYLGIQEFTGEMFLHHHEWRELGDKLSISEPTESSAKDRDFDLIDDDTGF